MTTLSERDSQVIWHPYTQHQMVPLPVVIDRAAGAALFDQQGNRFLDLVSSWWVNIHGHAHPEIAEAIYQQAMKLEHVIFSSFTHEPAVQFAEQLLAILPNHFSRVFYSDNGSTAVEAALKMAYQFWRNKNEMQRKRFIAFENAYHGDTFGAMSLGKKSGFFSAYEDLFFSVDFISYPETWSDDKNVQQKEQAVLAQLDEHLKKYGHETAALIIEPLIQGSSGMRMCRPEFLQQLEKRVQAYGILIIYDEVMTGFGRTGDTFACVKANTTPDIICLAKGIAGGFLPFAATVCAGKIYDAFLGNTFASALVHGHSFTGNPLGCAAALVSLDILQREETKAQQKMIERVHREGLAYLQQNTAIIEPRYCGTIAAFTLATATQYGSTFSLELRDRFLKQGLLIRPLGNVVYLMPPYCISEADLTRTYEVVAKELEGATIC